MTFEVNSFQLPNALVDDILRDISPNALKCYLIIIRKTKGWNKEWDSISTKQLIEISGIKKKNTIYCATKELEEYGLIETVKKVGRLTSYKVVPKMGTGTEKSSHQNGYWVVPKMGTGSSTENGYTTKDNIKDTLTKTKLSPISSLKKTKPQKTEREEKEKKRDSEKDFYLFIAKTRELYKSHPDINLYPPILQIKTQEGLTGYLKVDFQGHLYFHHDHGTEDIPSSEATHLWQYLYQNQHKFIDPPKENIKNQTQGRFYEAI